VDDGVLGSRAVALRARAKRGTHQLMQWNGVAPAPSYVAYVLVAGGRFTRGVVALGVFLVVLGLVEIVLNIRFRPARGRDIRRWSLSSGLVIAASTAAWALSMMVVVPDGVPLRGSGALVMLVALALSAAVYGMYERIVCFTLIAPLIAGAILSYYVRHDPDRVALTLASLILLAVVATMNSQLVRHTREALVNELERERLMTLLAREHAELDRRVRHDVLTGAPNRLAFTEAVEAAAADDRPVALLLVDLDGFKGVNDTLGHAVGDDVLVEVVKRLAVASDSSSNVFRLGGDEFAILSFDVSNASDLAERVIVSLGDRFVEGTRSCRVGASIGIASSEGCTGTDELLGHADRALYASKSAGRNRATLYSAHLPRQTITRQELEQGFERGEFVPHYQPIYSAATGEIEAFEALARWQRPDGTIVSPGRFVPAIESLGLHHVLGERMFLASIRDRQKLVDGGLIDESVRVHVNLSPVQLDGLEHVHSIVAWANQRGYAVDRVTVELTETSLLADADLARKILAVCQSYGVTVALDDFGTSYSSLSLLCEAPVDELKIDHVFVDDLVGNPVCGAIVAAVVELGRRLGVPVTAFGVDRFQGYLYSRPLPLAEFRELLGERTDSVNEIGQRRNGATTQPAEPVCGPTNS
jgi:diguanylate cyclase (GGDEF)-like protein